jgi:hypothetical protein
MLTKDGKSTTHASATIAAKELGLHHGTLVAVLKGRRYKSTGGYTAVCAEVPDLPKVGKIASSGGCSYMWKTLVSNMGHGSERVCSGEMVYNFMYTILCPVCTCIQVGQV